MCATRRSDQTGDHMRHQGAVSESCGPPWASSCRQVDPVPRIQSGRLRKVRFRNACRAILVGDSRAAGRIQTEFHTLKNGFSQARNAISQASPSGDSGPQPVAHLTCRGQRRSSPAEKAALVAVILVEWGSRSLDPGHRPSARSAELWFAGLMLGEIGIGIAGPARRRQEVTP